MPKGSSHGAASSPSPVGAAPLRLPLTSADPLAPRYEELKTLFPMAVTDGRVDLEKLRALMGDAAAGGPERYGLSWAGKSDALKTLRQQTTATLLPAPSESVNWGTTGNAIIEGDNLEVLKVLQHAYHGKVKLIYIDPPYNTGGDFIYPDDYAEGLNSYLQFTRQANEEGVKLTTNVNTSGRYHSRWLTMMYPRLFLARNLLRDDGVIFVSIDDHEVHNLRLLMDEIFGEENFVADVVWEKGRKNDAKLISVGHEYMMIFARNKPALLKAGVWREAKPGALEIQSEYEALRQRLGDDDTAVEQGLRDFYQGLPRGHPAKKLSRYNKVDKSGIWRDDNMSWPGGDGPTYNVIHPVTGKPCALPEGGWRYTEETMQQKIADGIVVFRADHSEPPIRKTYLLRSSDEDEDDESPIQVAGSYFYRSAIQATNVLTSIFGEKIFQNPKDHEVLMRWIRLAGSESRDDLILDFFAGSGTTGHAVLELNKEDGGTRQFILAQLPEPTGRKDFPSIAELTKERVRRVIQEMESADAGQLALSDGPRPNFGFKVFKLAPSNFAIWDPSLAPQDATGLSKQWELTADNVRADVSEQALLHELLLKCGLPLSSPIKTSAVAGMAVYLLDEGRLLICLDRELTREALRAMIDLKPQSVLCLDTGFKGRDALKVNAQLEFASHDIQFRTA